MSTSTISSLIFTGKQVVIYGGSVILVAGVLGEVLNVIVFVSLRIFRQSSCAFYLTMMAILNIGQLCAGMLANIMRNAYGSDGTDTSISFCKFRATSAYS